MTLFKKIILLILLLSILPHLSQALTIDFNDERAAAWETWKQLYIEGYQPYPAYGLVFDAGSCNYSNDSCDYAVSEGQGYGMLLAVIHNDQATFDKIFNAAEQWMWNGHSYGWKTYTDGNTPDQHAATDGDEDIAMALVLADKKQQRGEWQTTNRYGKKAQVLINNIYDYMTSAGYLWPGDYAGTSQELNFSYFSPAWYRVFDNYEQTNHDWPGVIDKQYTLLLNVAKRYNGLIPDWCTETGDTTNTGRPHHMTYDAIRIPWRIAIDSVWNNDARAKEYLNLVLPYVLSKGGVSQLKMYDIPGGNPIEWHNELSVSLWTAGAFGSSVVSDSDKQALVNEIQSYYNPIDRSFNKPWEPAKWQYYNQSLVLLATALLDNVFPAPDNTFSNTITTKQLKATGKAFGLTMIAKVAQKDDTVTVRLFTKQHQQKYKFFKTALHTTTTIHQLTIRHKRVRIRFTDGTKQTILLQPSLTGQVL